MDLSSLNPQQLLAVQKTEGPVLVLAGAGSGKTRVLAYRIAYLIKEKGVPARAILAITFTNKAAEEMRERVQGLVGPERGRNMWVMTFHAFCARLLREDGEAVGVSPRFVIYDAADQLNLAKRVVSGLGWDEKKYPPAALLAEVSRAKNELVSAVGYARDPRARNGRAGGQWHERVGQFYQRYQAELESNQALDFDDLLVKAVDLLAEPEMTRKWQDRFQYILVDEYQDTNRAQFRLLEALAGERRNVFVVGDPDQSIYGWRGADIRNILDFQRDFPGAEVIPLEENYRSTPAILACANAVVSHNQGRLPKNLWTGREDGPRPAVYVARDEYDEADFVAGEIENLRWRYDVPMAECAVLYRTNAQSRVFEEVLRRHDMPYMIVGGFRFYERQEVKDMIAWLRVLVNDADAVAVERALGAPRRGVGEGTVAKLRDAAATAGVPVLSIMTAPPEELGVTGRVRSGLQSFVATVTRLRAMVDQVPVDELIRLVADETGYRQALLGPDGRPGVESESRLENIEELARAAARYAQDADDPSLAGFLSAVSLWSDTDARTGAETGVRLMTMHAAKGLEFQAVFLVGMDEGVFPHLRALDDPDEMEEERRLCYVGITRARRYLYLVRARQRSRYGNTAEPTIPSRFLQEIPPELVQTVGPSARGMAPTGRAPAPSQRAAGPSARAAEPTGRAPAQPAAAGTDWSAAGQPDDGEADFTLVPGDHVWHPKWGEATVVAVSGRGPDAEIALSLPGQGIKRVVARYARLQKRRS